MQHSHAFPSPPGPTWQPVPDATPVILRFRPDEGTLKALALTQVELHKLRMAHKRMYMQASQEKQQWDKQRIDMEDQLRQMAVRSAEAERLFNDHMASLLDLLKDRQQQLQQIQVEYDALKGDAKGLIQALQQRLEDLQKSCQELQAKKEQLQEELRNAGVNVELGRKAQERVIELERAIDATQRRAQEMIANLDKLRMEAEHERDHVQERLQETQGALQQESELRGQRELEAMRLAIERQRLSNALEIERAINAPLYETDYARTTLAHVMRSVAAPTVASHSLTPHSPGSRATIPNRGVPASLDIVRVAGGAAVVSRPDLSQSFADRDLTRLGRSWATTTPTAGHPHPVYEDNIGRWRGRYQGVRPGQAEMQRARSAPRNDRTRQAAAQPGKGSPVYMTPQSHRRPRKVEESVLSTGRTLKY